MYILMSKKNQANYCKQVFYLQYSRSHAPLHFNLILFKNVVVRDIQFLNSVGTKLLRDLKQRKRWFGVDK